MLTARNEGNVQSSCFYYKGFIIRQKENPFCRLLSLPVGLAKQVLVYLAGTRCWPGHIITNENKRCFIYCIVRYFSQDAEGFNAVHHVHSIVLELQAKHEKLVQTTAELVNEYNRREKSLEELCSSIDRLEQNKADKKHVSQEIGIKVSTFMDRHVPFHR